MSTYFHFLKLHLLANRKYFRLTGYALLVLLFQVIIILSFQISYKEIFDAASQHKDYAVVLNWIYVILIASVLRVFVSMLSDYLVGLTTLKIFSGLRYQLFHHLQWLPAHFYQGVKIGDLVSRYSHDLQQSEMITRQFLPNLIRSVILGLLSAAVLFYFNWRLALFAICIFPFVILGARLFSTQATTATRHNQVANAELANMIEEVATQHILLQAFNLQSRFIKKFQGKLFAYKKDFMKGIFLRGMVSRTSIFGLSLSEIFVFSLGAIMTYHGEMTIGTLFGFFALIWNLSGAVDTIAQNLPNFIEAGGSIKRIQDLLDEKIEEPVLIEEKERKPPLPLLSKTIRFKDVSFHYSNNKPILKNINLEIAIGSSVALVGSTGSGKSSILSLLMGFYYPTSGTLELDGKNIQEVSPISLRSQIGIVLQQNPLFNTTLRENIRMGRETASDAEVEEAAIAAEIHDFIMTLPQGYETQVLEYGSNLSGGQKQRLAIARVYLRQPTLILLDEPTSALDVIVEGQINALLTKLKTGKTMILATHRLAALHAIDSIYVIDRGEITEQGSHEELLSKKGCYYNLWQKQQGISLNKEGNRAKIEIGFLRNIPLLRELPEPLLATLADEFIIECVDVGQTLFKKGDFGDKFYIIFRGQVEVCDPDLQSLAVLEDGDYFGEIALLKDNQQRTATIKTLSYCMFLVLHSSQFLKLKESLKRL